MSLSNMHIPSEPFDREEQDNALVCALRSSNSAIYIDTSVLVWLYRLRGDARNELTSLLESPEIVDRTHIPMWSLHELNKHRGNHSVLLPIISDAKKLTALIEEVKNEARLFVDEAFVAGTQWNSVEEYLKILDDAGDLLSSAVKPLKQASGVEKIDEQLAPFLRSRALKRALPSLANLREEYEARCEGRLPPGYKDANKLPDQANDQSFAGANRFGDLVFWRTVVEHAASDENIETVIILSHDSKQDWVHSPKMYVGYGAKKTPNNGKNGLIVTCPQPILSFEIEIDAKIERLFIVTVQQLVWAISRKGDANTVTQLARAIQIEEASKTNSTDDGNSTVVEGEDASVESVDDSADVLAEGDAPLVGGEEITQDTPVDLGIAANPLQLYEISARLNALPNFALADAEYVNLGEGDPEAEKAIAGLKSHDWYKQNPAALAVYNALISDQVTDAQLFVIGRNLYQAACGNAWRAGDFIKNLPFYSDKAYKSNDLIIFAGALFEVYFGADGNVRHEPKIEQLAVLFDMSMIPEYSEPAAWLRQRLGVFVDRFLLLPGRQPSSIIFDIHFDETDIPQSISVGGVQITEHVQPIPLNFDHLPRNGVEQRMLSRLTSHFSLPAGRVSVDPSYNDSRSFEHLKLRDWSPQGDLVFPQDV
jgi:hypothetical protein